MQKRILGKTGYEIGEVGFGAWAIGGSWGAVSEDDALSALNAAVDGGTTFFDTADVYGDGRSERLIAQLRSEHPAVDLTVATKAGRRLDPHISDGYVLKNLEPFVDRSLSNLAAETLDLVQLHCPPTDVYYRLAAFDALDYLVTKGKVRHYGVSVERVEEAIKAMEFPGVATVQIIFNAFRLRPSERLFAMAAENNVGVIVRVPLASGMLTGKMTADTVFASDDHRSFNRHGESFDMGETFSGVPYEVALAAVDELRQLVPGGATMAQWALRWILMFDEVSVVIPGAKNAEQASANAGASGLPTLDTESMSAVQDTYDRLIRPHVHHRW